MLHRKSRGEGRPSYLHNPVHVNIILERDRLKDFKEVCHEAGLNVSEGIRQLMESALEKKEEGSQQKPNPLNLPNSSYTDISKNPFANHDPQQLITMWLPRKQAIDMAKHIPLDKKQWQWLSETFGIIARQKPIN